MGRPKENLEGQHFGEWTVLNENSIYNGKTYWKCKCSCGTIRDVRADMLKNHSSSSCGCLQKKKQEEKEQLYIDKIKQIEQEELDFLSQKYGLLTPILKDPISHKYKCLCDCGNYHYVTKGNLKNGNVKSCGCSKSIVASNIKYILQQNNINFKTEYTFSDLLSPDNNIRLRFDFAIFNEEGKLSHLIEYDGETHFRYTSSGWNTKERFLKQQRNDKLKNEYCKQHNIKLLRIPYTKKNSININLLLMKGDD